MDYILYELNSPYDQFDKEFVRKLYSDSLKLKLEGYNNIYKNILPNDIYDFMSDFFIFCVPTVNGLRSICSVKFVRLSQTKRFGLELPCFPLARTFNGKGIEKELLVNMSNYHDKVKEETDVFYVSSLSLDKEFRKTSLGKEIVDMVFVAITRYSIEKNAKGIIIAGMKKVGTGQRLHDIGFERFKDKSGNDIGYLKSPGFNNELAIMMKYKKWTKSHLELCDRLIDKYEKRLIIGTDDKVKKLMAA